MTDQGGEVLMTQTIVRVVVIDRPSGAPGSADAHHNATDFRRSAATSELSSQASALTLKR